MPPAVPEAADLESLDRHPPAAVLPLQDGTKVHLASRERGRELLSRPDGYTARLSRFDLVAKLQGEGERTESGYLAHAREQALDWGRDAAWRMSDAVIRVGRALERTGLRLPLPPVLEIVLSSLWEEGGMHGYTRRGYVVLSEAWLRPETFAHELLHVVTRRRPDLRKRFFGLLGAELVEPIGLPEDLAAQVITNPDAPAVDAVMRVHWEGREVEVAPFLLAAGEWQGGALSRYVRPTLLLVEGANGARRPVLRDGRAIVLRHDEVHGLHEQLGGNTDYDWHPEEVTAEHLELLLAGARNLPRPDLVHGLGEILQGRGPAA